MRSPGPQRRDEACYRSMIEGVAPKVPQLFCGGKSYGGRIASHLAAEGVEMSGLVFLGYPLHPPGKPDRLRVDHWPAVGAPTLFLQGTRDPLCDLDLLRQSLHLLRQPATLEIVDGGDHSLDISAKVSHDGTRHPAPEVLRRLAPALAAWIDSLGVTAP
jgi:uncharacterized protein